MSQTDPFTTPQDEIRAWHRHRAGAGSGLSLTPDLLTLAQSGAAILFAARTAEGRPTSGTGISCRALAPDRLRMVLSAGANRPVLEALRHGSRIAVTFTGSQQHHQSFQIKAGTADILPVRPDDLPEMERQSQLFCEGLGSIGFTRELAEGWLLVDPDDLIAMEVTPERVFTQTPGPGAGAELLP
ncbi:hypothetical protein ATO6_15940 [Oceanicola sp. 22II-s10i]|uniref:hypothetical protein n=1 Tax=Oceanicola sp. 22II-s10i TaxID=1317116 RepID=UPI000B522164|nr:hypothetical protein [Oceanicola sp. 22II-s10i]OWU83905.1 hypothetical protein ATO6_15940 [Oceanicola sp. 22II-s10i]